MRGKREGDMEGRGGGKEREVREEEDERGEGKKGEGGREER